MITHNCTSYEPVNKFDFIDASGLMLYNFNIVETTEQDKIGTERTVYRYDSLLVTPPITANTVFSALLSATVSPNHEAKLLNDYYAAQNGIEPPERAQPYLDFLNLRKTLRDMVDADCTAHNIPLTDKPTEENDTTD